MILTLTPTDQITQFNGQRVRVWTGETDKGIRYYAMIAGICPLESSDQSEFEKALIELPEPREISLRNVLAVEP